MVSLESVTAPWRCVGAVSEGSPPPASECRNTCGGDYVKSTSEEEQSHTHTQICASYIYQVEILVSGVFIQALMAHILEACVDVIQHQCQAVMHHNNVITFSPGIIAVRDYKYEN